MSGCSRVSWWRIDWVHVVLNTTCPSFDAATVVPSLAFVPPLELSLDHQSVMNKVPLFTSCRAWADMLLRRVNAGNRSPGLLANRHAPFWGRVRGIVVMPFFVHHDTTEESAESAGACPVSRTLPSSKSEPFKSAAGGILSRRRKRPPSLLLPRK